MQINGLTHALDGVKLPEHKPSLPPRRTPPPVVNKVVSRPVRVPINRQAALLISPMRSWLSQPIAEKLPTKEQKEIDQLKAELQIERNRSATTCDALGNVRIELKSAKTLIEKLQTQIGRLQAEAAEKDDTIRQLEDLRL